MNLILDGLKEKLLEATGDEDLSDALFEAAQVVAPKYGGAPADFGKAVYEQMKKTDPDMKAGSGGVYNKIVRVLAESIQPDKIPDKPPDKQPLSVKVRLPEKISAYGGGFHDPMAKVWIKGNKIQEVKLTLFVQQKIASGELIEVR
jgi:hypothetical protein